MKEESDAEDKRSEERKERTGGGIGEFDEHQDIEVDTTVVPQNTNAMSLWLTTARTDQQAGGMREDKKNLSAEALINWSNFQLNNWPEIMRVWLTA